MAIPAEKQAQFKSALERLRADTEKTIADLQSRAAPVELDQQSVGRLSRIDAIQQQAMALGTLERMKREITRVDAALKRMDEGRYGICCHCEQSIGEVVLHHDPAVPFCLQCRQEFESNRRS